MKYLAARLGNTKFIAPMRSIYLERQTGILEIEGPELKKRLYFVDGELHLRRSDLPLTRTISAYLELEEPWAEARQAARPGEEGNGSRVGATADEGDLRLLAKLIGQQWTAWNATSCRFVQGLDTPVGHLVGPLPTARLLVAAARAAETENVIVEQLGGMHASIVAAPDDASPAGSIITSAEDALMVELCRKPVTVGEVIATANGSRVDTLQTLSRLWVTGLLRPFSPVQDDLGPARWKEPESSPVDIEEEEFQAADSQAHQIWRAHFRLSGDPFSLTPDPAFLFLSEGHAEALAALKVGLLEGRGLTVLTGEVGTGKTTLLYALLSDIGPEVETAFIANTTLSLDEILRSALDDLGAEYVSDSRVDLLKSLNNFLLECNTKGKTVALVVDEAHALSVEAFEGLRQLLNFETYNRKLLQILLVGQPELGARLRHRHLRQVADRIAVRCHLEALTRGEARRYIEHRLESAGAAVPVFSRRAVDLVVRESRRIPRSINVLCHNAMLFAFAKNLTTVRRSLVREAVRERRGRWSTGLAILRAFRIRGLIGLMTMLFAIAWSGFSLVGSSGGVSPTEPAAAEPAPVSGPQSGAVSTADPAPVPLAGVERADSSLVRITTRNLNLRAGPSLGDRILATLPQGTEVVLLSDEAEWAIIRHEDRAGWVKSSYLMHSSISDSSRSAR